jgi:hypothetical protein
VCLNCTCTENILADLEAVLCVNETERYEKFLAVIDKYGYLHKDSIQSVNEFDKIYNHLLDLLLLNADSGPWLDLSKFDKGGGRIRTYFGPFLFSLTNPLDSYTG